LFVEKDFHTLAYLRPTHIVEGLVVEEVSDELGDGNAGLLEVAFLDGDRPHDFL
jgi:hypothetical protein